MEVGPDPAWAVACSYVGAHPAGSLLALQLASRRAAQSRRGQGPTADWAFLASAAMSSPDSARS
jgi:hypothetical protein